MWQRFVAFLWVAAFGALAVVLLLSDRGGDAFTDVVNKVATVGRRLETEYGVDVIDRDDIPGDADDIVHAFFWGAGMLLIGWVARRRVPVIITALFVGAISLAFELAQPVLSATRGLEVSDAVSNLVGVAFATGVLFVSLAIIRRLYGDDRYYGRAADLATAPEPGPVAHPYRDDTTDELFLQH